VPLKVLDYNPVEWVVDGDVADENNRDTPVLESHLAHYELKTKVL
jgi:hypothetical protein